MGNAGELARENEALRQRLSRLSEASLRTNDSDEPVRCAARRPRRRQRREPEPVRILCVDDDPETLRYVRDALTRAGYAPVVTEDVPRLMAEEPPRLVLLDLVLPGSGDGIELMGQVREIADVPVIFLSVVSYRLKVSQSYKLELSHPGRAGIIAEASVEVPARIAERWPSERDLRVEGARLLRPGDCSGVGAGPEHGTAVPEGSGGDESAAKATARVQAGSIYQLHGPPDLRGIGKLPSSVAGDPGSGL